MYEFAVTGAAAVGVAYLAFRRRRVPAGLGLWVCALLLLTLGIALAVLYSPADDLVPVLDSAWLVVHVSAAIVAGALFTVGFLATASMLVRSRSGRRPPTAAASEAHERISHTAHLIAFPIWTFAVIAGAIWAENAWGRYWGWDPKETWAFITWVCYAGYLHAQATTGWRGTRAAWLAVAGYAAFLFNFFGVNIWLPGLHSYAGV
jgi:cytochrome c-type biogenesis protein CcsB